MVEPTDKFGVDGVQRYPLDAPVFTVVGFAAVTALAAGTDPDPICQIGVDVMDKQTLVITYQHWAKTEPMNHDLACQKARQAAELVMTTLLER